MKVTLLVDFVNEEVNIIDEFGNASGETIEGQDFWGICPEHIGYSLNNFLKDNWDFYKGLVNNPEYLKLKDRYEKLLVERAKLYAKLESNGLE